LSVRRSLESTARWGGRMSAELRSLAIRAGISSYESALRAPTVAQWTHEYEAGHWDYLDSLDQLARYSILAGYCWRLDHRSILDVGCGAGIFRARVGYVDFESYVGIDPVAAAIEQASRLVDDRTTFLIGDVFLPQLEQFEIVVCNEVLYSLPQPARQLDRIRDLVRPGGHMLTSHIRHPGDVGLYRLIAERFELIDAVDLRNLAAGAHPRRVAAYRRTVPQGGGRSVGSTS
jgi:2-polyprenyl-3-methyl-5-hydroxy-6-metoxy-1,4-benzoquinol methylase